MITNIISGSICIIGHFFAILGIGIIVLEITAAPEVTLRVSRNNLGGVVGVQGSWRLWRCFQNAQC